jgi:hypothetical protein
LYQQLYVYTEFKVLLAYRLALCVSTIGVFIGLAAMTSNGMAYSNQLSTVLRTSRYARITTPVHPDDADGRDPLPTYLTKMNISFREGSIGQDLLGNIEYVCMGPTERQPTETSFGMLDLKGGTAAFSGLTH